MLKFIHPGTIKQGYLTKSPPLKKRGLKGWKKRWCIFAVTSDQPYLKYYHSEDEAMHGLPIKRVSLADCSKVDINLKHSSFKNIFAIHLPERIYYFSAPSQTEMLEWVDALCSHLKLGASLLSHGSATMPSTPPIPRTPLSYEPRMGGSLPRLPSQTPSQFSRPPPPDSPLPPIPGGARPPPPNSPLPPLPPEPSSSRPNPRSVSPLVIRGSDTPPLPPPREFRSHSALPPPPLPHAPRRFNGSATIENEHSPPPPPRRSVSAAHERVLSPGYKAKTLGKESSPDTADDEDCPPPPPRRRLSTSAVRPSSYPNQDQTLCSEHELDPPRNGDQSSSSENTPSPDHKAKSHEATDDEIQSPDHTTKSLEKEPSADDVQNSSPSQEANPSEKDSSSPDSTDESDSPPDPPPRSQELPSPPPVTSAPPCDIVVTS